MPIPTGQIIGNRYRVVKLVGQGGFGAVYRAWDLRLNTPCALKESRVPFPDAVSRFQREASLLANLRHSNLPRVIDYFDIPDKGQYLVMDFVEGEDLEAMLHRLGPLSFVQICPWIVQVCEALNFLHTQPKPVIHRDIKPANIKITPQGQAILVDFGTAKKYDPSSAATPASVRSFTPAFSPIEQFGYGKTDARSDIYALGATLYLLLTGQDPPTSTERMAGKPLPQPSAIKPDIPLPVETAILRAMQLLPEHRYQSVVDFQADLTQSAASLHQPARSESLPGSLSEAANISEATIIVAASGSAHYRSIAQAVQNAVPGAMIRVQPGTYHEELHIDKPVEIVGDGPLDEVVIESTDGDCLIMETDNANLRGLTLRNRSGSRGGKSYTVDIPRGRLVLEDCDISSDSLACVAIHGPDAEPVLRGCKIHDGRSGGIFIYDGSKGLIEDCEIFGNGRAGIAIRTGGDPIIRRCNIFEGKQSGVYIYESGMGSLEECNIFSNALTGVEIKQGGNARIRHCAINRNRYQAIYIHENSTALVEDSDLSGNLRGAWYIGDHCIVNRSGNQE
jgi:parallel beta-helix repeat protein